MSEFGSAERFSFNYLPSFLVNDSSIKVVNDFVKCIPRVRINEDIECGILPIRLKHEN